MTNFLYASPGGVTPVQITPSEDLATQALVSGAGNNSASPAYVILSPSTSLLPTFTVLSNVAAPTATPVTINGERWLRFDTTTSGAGANSFDISFNVALPNPVAVDSATIEFAGVSPVGSGPLYQFYLGTAGAYTVFTSAQWAGSAVSQTDPISCLGHSAATFHRTRINAAPTGFSGETLQQPVDVCKLRVAFASAAGAGEARQFFLRSITLGGAARKGRLAIIADDGYASFLQRGVPILERRGLKSTMSIIAPHPNFPGVGIDSQTLFATTQQLRDYVAAGNFCVPHGPSSVSTNLYTGTLAVGFGGASVATQNAARVADMVYGRQWLLDRGLTDARGAACYVLPEGRWNSGDSQTDLLDAMYAAGFRLGRSATGHPNNGPISGSNYERFTYLRLLSQQNRWRLIVPYLGHLYVGATNTPDDATETANIAKIVLAIQNLAACGADGMLMLHQVVSRGAATAASLHIETDRLDSIAAAVQALVAAGTLECVGMPEMVNPLHLT